jgi:hypothetical protein
MENVPHLVDNPEKPTADKVEKKDKDDSKKKKRAGEHVLKAEKEKRESVWESLKKKPEEVEPVSEAKAPADGTLSAEEKPLAVKAAAEASALAVPEHAAEAVSEAVAEDLAARDFLEEAATTGDIEEAAARTLSKLGASAEEITALNAPEEEPAEIPKAMEESDEPVEEIVFERAAPAGPEPAPDEIEENDETAAGAGGTTPPLTPPPSPPGAGGPGFIPHPGPNRPAPIPTLSGNLYHTPITPDSPAVERYDQGNPAVTALIGGIIGYFIGRRRGRIRAEKQAVKVQRKLEKQIENIHWQLKAKETQIRRVAAEKVRSNGLVVVEAMAGKHVPETKPKPAEQLNPVERRSAPEASQLHGAKKTHERLGRMLITAEAVAGPRPEKSSAVVSRQTKPESGKMAEIPQYLRGRQVETLSRNDLLLVSEKIIVDGTSLRQIYETHLVGEKGLRRLVAEHLRGGDVKKILRQEIVEHEIDFERDPAVRDVAVPGPSGSTAVRTNKAALDQLLEKASASLGDNGPEAVAYYKARAAYEQEQQDQVKHRLIDVGLTVTITILIVLVIVLYLTRH